MIGKSDEMLKQLNIDVEKCLKFFNVKSLSDSRDAMNVSAYVLYKIKKYPGLAVGPLVGMTPSYIFKVVKRPSVLKLKIKSPLYRNF